MTTDFSKAPKGATHYLCGPYPRLSYWKKRADGTWFEWTGAQWCRIEWCGEPKCQPIPTPHPHAALMAEYAEDAAVHPRPWELWQVKTPEAITTFKNPPDKDGWVMCIASPTWNKGAQYRRKPTPTPTIMINGHEVPEPISKAPANGTWVYGAVVGLRDDGLNNGKACLYYQRRWYDARGTCALMYLYKAGLLHSTKEAAIAHAKALLSFTERTCKSSHCECNGGCSHGKRG